MTLKKLLIGALAGSCLLAGAFLYSLKTNSPQEEYRIAIFQPAQHPALEEIARGFSETIVKQGKKRYRIENYNAGGNSTILRAQAEEIVQNRYDLVFTIGAQCSQLLYHLTQKKGHKTPQVFAVVDDPLSLGIVQSLTVSGTQATGVLATRFYKDQIDALLRIKPSTKRVLLVYNPAQGSGLEKDRKQLEQLLALKGLSLQAVEVAHHNEISQKVPAFLPNADVVLVLMDNTVVTGITSLIGLCSRYKVPLYTSDLASCKKGAALSFAAEDYEYGVLGAQLAQEILEKAVSGKRVSGKRVSEIPLMQPPVHRLAINTKTMQQQGLTLDDTLLNQIKKEGGLIL